MLLVVLCSRSNPNAWSAPLCDQVVGSSPSAMRSSRRLRSCAKCAFYRPKGSAKALFIEGKTGLLRLKQDIPLTDAEAAAIDDGVTAFDNLLTKLADVPTPAGPTPRQLQESAESEPTKVKRA
jgi:hypothetical protein